MAFGFALFGPSVEAVNRLNPGSVPKYNQTMTSVTDSSISHNIKGLTEETGNKLPLSFDHDGNNMDKENNEVAAPNKESAFKGTKPDLITSSAKSPTIMASSFSSAAPIPGNQDEELGVKMAKATVADEMASVVRTPKRLGYLSWEDFFMGVAVLSSKRSKDPISPTGACLVDKQQRIVGIGYNGFPRGCSDDVLPWTTGQPHSDGDLPWLHTKEPWMCHAVTNAILNKCSHDVEGCSLYVTQFPCSDCAKMIIQSRISQVVVRLVDDGRSCHGCNSTLPLLTKESETNKEPIDPDTRASQILLEMAGVHVQYYRPTVKSVTIDFGIIAPFVSTSKSETDACACAGEDSKQEQGNNEEASPISAKGKLNQDENKNEFRDDELRNKAYQLLWQEAKYDPRISPQNKRKDYISWSEYFMVSISIASANLFHIYDYFMKKKRLNAIFFFRVDAGYGLPNRTKIKRSQYASGCMHCRFRQTYCWFGLQRISAGL